MSSRWCSSSFMYLVSAEAAKSAIEDRARARARARARPALAPRRTFGPDLYRSRAPSSALLSDRRAERGERGREPGVRGRDVVGVVDRGRAVGDQPGDRGGHRDPVIAVGMDPRGGERAIGLALDGEAVGVGL